MDGGVGLRGRGPRGLREEARPREGETAPAEAGPCRARGLRERVTMTDPTVTSSELMVTIAARELRDGGGGLAGVGIPNLAANLAKRMHAPYLILIYESGTIGSHTQRLPLSVGAPCLSTGAQPH